MAEPKSNEQFPENFPTNPWPAIRAYALLALIVVALCVTVFFQPADEPEELSISGPALPTEPAERE